LGPRFGFLGDFLIKDWVGSGQTTLTHISTISAMVATSGMGTT